MDFTGLLKEFGPVKWYDKTILGWRGWFLLEISPLPPTGEKELVAADICREELVTVNNGKVYHCSDCSIREHKLSQKLRRAVEQIPDEKFLVAVYGGEPGILNGQPIAIVLEPEISYAVYPDHPHISQGFHKHIDTEFYIPDSVCYTNDPSNLGDDKNSRLLTVFDEMCIWLFRHQLWLATRHLHNKGEWIGPSEGNLLPQHYASHLNPLGKCHCGKDRVYRDCCMPNDVMIAVKCDRQEAIKRIDRFVLQGLWKRYIGTPQKNSLDRLKRAIN